MQEIHIQCPYCLQAISILLDTGVYGHETVVDDCEVCCRPIEISYIVENHEIKTYSYNSIEENKSFAILKVKFDLEFNKNIIKTYTYEKKILCKTNDPYGFVIAINQAFEEVVNDLSLQL